MYIDFQQFFVRKCIIDFLFDVFSSGFIDQVIVIMSYISNNGFVKFIIFYLYGIGIDNVVQGNNSNFGGIIINIYNY